MGEEFARVDSNDDEFEVIAIDDGTGEPIMWIVEKGTVINV